MSTNTKTDKELIHEALSLIPKSYDFKQGVTNAYNYLLENSESFRDFCNTVSMDDIKPIIEKDIESALEDIQNGALNMSANYHN